MNTGIVLILVSILALIAVVFHALFSVERGWGFLRFSLQNAAITILLGAILLLLLRK